MDKIKMREIKNMIAKNLIVNNTASISNFEKVKNDPLRPMAN
jgi:hypothetical protein